MIDAFFGEYRWLSNFHVSPTPYKGVTYSSVEHGYQALKAATRDEHNWVASSPKPKDAKQRGRQIKMRSDWESVKLSIMYELVKSKFMNDEELKEKLLATGDERLVEGNTWGDTFWGVCNNSGQNHLGQILMRVRTELRV